jgi:hypothetical protein
MKIFLTNTLLISAFSFSFFAFAQQQQRAGYATHFDGLGTPYGGCGVPDQYVGSEDYVALNVFNAPNTGSSDFTRPLTGADVAYMGEFQNGLNCGRWVKVTISADCLNGQNGGELGKGFCTGTNASWQNDGYSGATKYMLVADACGDNNGWCRQSQYHLDLHTPSLNTFEQNNVPVQTMYPTHFNNREITWEYVNAPNYIGDINIYFMQNSFEYWSSIFITNLEKGIHGIEQKVGNSWVKLKMNSDMGQAYLLDPSVQTFQIRVIDANDAYIQNGREYTFELPVACEGNCSQPATAATYQTYNQPPITTGINAPSSTPAILLFPNPTQHTVQIKNHLGGNWILYNNVGQLITQGNMGVIDCSDYTSGVYFLELDQKWYRFVKTAN